MFNMTASCILTKRSDFSGVLNEIPFDASNLWYCPDSCTTICEYSVSSWSMSVKRRLQSLAGVLKSVENKEKGQKVFFVHTGAIFG